MSINSNVVFHRLPSPATSFHKFIEPTYMDQISIKTPNPKCRLYWRLIDFIDWRFSHSCWYFRPLLWTSAPLSFSLVHLPPPPLPCVNKNRGTCIHTVCNRGWDRETQIDKHLPPSTLSFKKSRHLGFGVFIDIWSMVFTLRPSIRVPPPSLILAEHLVCSRDVR